MTQNIERSGGATDKRGISGAQLTEAMRQLGLRPPTGKMPEPGPLLGHNSAPDSDRGLQERNRHRS